MVNEVILKQFEMGNYVIKGNLGDVSHEESLVQPQQAGNCANWVVGHIIVYRCRLLTGLGAQAIWDESEYKTYERHEAPLTRAEDAKPFADLLAAVDETAKRLEAAISALTPEQLAEQAPFIHDDEPGGTIQTALTAFAFHDAYHAGQTGLLRRIVGKPPKDF